MRVPLGRPPRRRRRAGDFHRLVYLALHRSPRLIGDDQRLVGKGPHVGIDGQPQRRLARAGRAIDQRVARRAQLIEDGAFAPAIIEGVDVVIAGRDAGNVTGAGG